MYALTSTISPKPIAPSCMRLTAISIMKIRPVDMMKTCPMLKQTNVHSFLADASSRFLNAASRR